MPDALFADPRLAGIYDAVDSDRTDLDVYAGLVEALGAESVLDIGCGTGSFACLLAARGIEVTGVDPAAASLDVARLKPYADRVRWVRSDATSLPPMQVEVAGFDGLEVRGAPDRPGMELVFIARKPEAGRHPPLSVRRPAPHLHPGVRAASSIQLCSSGSSTSSREVTLK